MPNILHCASFFTVFADSEQAKRNAEIFISTHQQAASILFAQNAEIARHRREYELYCHAMEANNKELDAMDKQLAVASSEVERLCGRVDALTHEVNRAKHDHRQAQLAYLRVKRNLCWVVAGWVFTLIGFVAWAVLR